MLRFYFASLVVFTLLGQGASAEMAKSASEETGSSALAGAKFSLEMLAVEKVIRSLTDTKDCSSFNVSLEREKLEGQFFSSSEVRFLRISYQNPYGQENIAYSKGPIKIEHSGVPGKQQESITFELDQSRSPRGAVHQATALELIHDGKGKLIDFRILRHTDYLGSKADDKWDSVCKKS